MPGQPYRNLFSPFTLRGLTLPNRIVMAPMETYLSDSEGAVTAAQIAYYRERAAGGPGLVIVEACCVDGVYGRLCPKATMLDSRKLVDGHRRLVEAIAGTGTLVGVQLIHAGPQCDRSLIAGGIAVGPSDVRSPTDPDALVTRALSATEIESLIESYAQAAQFSVEAGYQLVEIHGAHGYLLSAFLSPHTNHRQDAWGGDEERRLAFPRRVIERTRQVIGDRPLLYRFSAAEFVAGGLTIEDMERITPKLVAAGVDLLDMSTGLMYGSVDRICDPVSATEGWRIPYARRLRAASKAPVLAIGPFREPLMAEQAVAEGSADLIALGRPLLADADWVNKARDGAEQTIRPCISCNYCLGEHSVGGFKSVVCAVNPRVGRELEYLPVRTAQHAEKAVVVGAGPGGMVASLLLEQAGFDTHLYEARSMLGGGLIASSAVAYKLSIARYQHYLENRLKASSVAVKLNTQATLSALAEQKPAIVVLATGGRANKMPITGQDCGLVYDAYDALMGDESWQPPGRDLPIVVYGGGEAGCETAEYLTDRGYEVVLITRSSRNDLVRSAEFVYRTVFMKMLTENHRIRIVERTNVVSIDADGTVNLQAHDGTRWVVKASRLMIAQGRRPDSQLEQALAQAQIPFVVIGDGRHSGRIADAVHDAYAAVMCLRATAVVAPQLAC